MSYPYGRPGDASGGQSGSGGQRGVGAPGGQWVPVPGSGGRRSSAGVIVGCVVGLVVAALVVGVAFLVVRSRSVEPGSTTANPTANPTAFNPTTTGAPTPLATGNGEQYSADFLGVFNCLCIRLFV